jgi:hypothetical protein
VPFEGPAITAGGLDMAWRVWAKRDARYTRGNSNGFAAPLWIALAAHKAFITVTNVGYDMETKAADEAASLCARFDSLRDMMRNCGQGIVSRRGSWVHSVTTEHDRISRRILTKP